MAKSVIVCLIQPEIVESHREMDSKIIDLVARAATKKPDIIMLPERWRSVPPKEEFLDAIEEERGHSYQLLKDLAKKSNTYILTGGIWEKRKSDFYITSYVFDGEGNELGRQDKIHLYNYEPTVFTPGSELQVFTHQGVNTKFTVLICFDIAFFETPRLAVENGAELLLSPTLIRKEGLYNWSIYLQARALENRVPVAACNPVGSIFGNKYLGKSKIISFKRGHHSPSVLKIRECKENSSDILVETVNVSFPNRLRKVRLSEKRDNISIRVRKS